MAGLLEFDQLVDRRVDLVAGHVALVLVVDEPGGGERAGGVEHAGAGEAVQRGLALELRRQQIGPGGDRAPGQVGADAERVGIVKRRDVGDPLGVLAGELAGIAGRVDMEDFRGIEAVAALGAVIEDALGEDRHDLVVIGDLLLVDRLEVPRRPQDRDVRRTVAEDLPGVGLGRAAGEQRVAVERVHLDLEGQLRIDLVLEHLVVVGRVADLADDDILDVLRPDRREAGDRAAADREAGRRGRAFQNRPPRGTDAAGLVGLAHLDAPCLSRLGWLTWKDRGSPA